MPDTQTVSNNPRCVIRKCVLSYPRLFQPAQFQGEGPFWYSAAFLLDPRTQAAEVAKLNAACEAAADKAWPRGEWREKWKSGNQKNFWWPIRDGAEKGDKNGYVGKVFVQAKSQTKPGVVDRDVEPVMDQDLIYPGMIVNASVNFVGFTRPGWGVGCYLQNVQIVGDGERLGGKPDPSSDFEPIADAVPANTNFLR